jgi:hypothetical protein
MYQRCTTPFDDNSPKLLFRKGDLAGGDSEYPGFYWLSSMRPKMSSLAMLDFLIETPLAVGLSVSESQVPLSYIAYW